MTHPGMGLARPAAMCVYFKKERGTTAMLKVEKSVVIDAPVHRVFDYVADPMHLPEYWEGINEVKDVRKLPNGDYALTAVGNVLGLRIEESGEVVEFVPNERLVVKGHGSLYDSTTTIQFEKLGADKTRVNAVGEYTFRGPLVKFGEPFLARYTDHAAEMTIAAAKVHIETTSPAEAAR